MVFAVIAGVFVAFVAAHADEPRIAADAFLASPATKALQAGDNARALRELDALARQYPDDPLILRYRALALIRLGRTPEAIAILRQLLLRSPQHVPTHLFLGQAYLRQGDRAAAADEWRWIAQHSDAEEYRRWAQAQLQRMRTGTARKPAPKKTAVCLRRGRLQV